MNRIILPFVCCALVLCVVSCSKDNVNNNWNLQDTIDEEIETTQKNSSSNVEYLGNFNYSDPFTEGLIFETLPDEEGYAVASYDGASKNVVIPKIYRGFYVVRILDDAFKNISKLETVSIPDSVHYIGHHAFYGCSKINNINIPDNVTYIGQGAFSGCASLISITIPDGVTTLRGDTFHGCSNLTEVIIPSSVTSIGNYDFSDCSELSTITIPNTVTHIGQSAFAGCSSLNTVYYEGREDDWQKIRIDSYNFELKTATRYYE